MVTEGPAPEPCLSQILCLLEKNSLLRCEETAAVSRKENTICENKNPTLDSTHP